MATSITIPSSTNANQSLNTTDSPSFVSAKLGGAQPAYVDDDWDGFSPLMLGPVDGYGSLVLSSSLTTAAVYAGELFAYRGAAAAPTKTLDQDVLAYVMDVYGFTGTDKYNLAYGQVIQNGDGAGTPSGRTDFAARVAAGGFIGLAVDGEDASIHQSHIDGNTVSMGSAEYPWNGLYSTDLSTDNTTAHTLTFRAYDVDGTAYKVFATLTNANTPDLTIAPPSGGTVTVQASTFKSSDGSTGATGTATAVNTLTIKNGLITNIA